MTVLATQVYTKFEDCADELRAVHARARNGNPFLTLEWLNLWWQHFRPRRSLYLLLFRGASGPVGLAPLYRSSSPFGQAVEYRFLGHGVSSYLDVLCEPGLETAVIKGLLSHFETAAGGSLLDLADINDRFSRCYPALMAESQDPRYRASAVHLYPCPLATLGDNWETFLQTRRDKKSRHNLRRSERQLTRLSSWHVREIKDPKDVARVLPEIARIHQERFTQTVNSLFKGPKGAFWISAIQQLLGKQLVVSVLELDGTVVSFLIGFKYGEVFTDFAPAFDPAWGCVSVGQVHLMCLLRELTREGFKYFDFSKGEAAYKRWWSDGESANYRFRFGFNLTASSRLYERCVRMALGALLVMRRRGYNAQIKRWAAMGRMGWWSAMWEGKVQVSKFSSPPFALGSAFRRWSYPQLKELPLKVRKAAVECAVRLASSEVTVAELSAERTVVILPANHSEGFLIRY